MRQHRHAALFAWPLRAACDYRGAALQTPLGEAVLVGEPPHLLQVRLRAHPLDEYVVDFARCASFLVPRQQLPNRPSSRCG